MSSKTAALGILKKARKVKKHLTMTRVRELRRRAAAGEPTDTLAKAFKVAVQTVRNIVSGRTRREKNPSSPPFRYDD